jgi:hypothetical protein
MVERIKFAVHQSAHEGFHKRSTHGLVAFAIRGPCLMPKISGGHSPKGRAPRKPAHGPLSKSTAFKCPCRDEIVSNNPQVQVYFLRGHIWIDVKWLPTRPLGWWLQFRCDLCIVACTLLLLHFTHQFNLIAVRRNSVKIHACGDGNDGEVPARATAA